MFDEQNQIYTGYVDIWLEGNAGCSRTHYPHVVDWKGCARRGGNRLALCCVNCLERQQVGAGWLVLVIFFAIATVVVRRIQDSLSKAREATFMYELSSALANMRTQDAVAHTVAKYIRQLYQASQVNVTFQ